MALINFALSPIKCIVAAIESILNSLPTPNNLKDNLTAEQFEFTGLNTGQLGGEEVQSIEDAIATYKKKAQADLANGEKQMKQDFQKMLDSVEEAFIIGYEETIKELFGVSNYLDCEEKRTGSNVVEKITAVFELVQMANMLIAVIDKKSQNEVFDSRR